MSKVVTLTKCELCDWEILVDDIDVIAEVEHMREKHPEADPFGNIDRERVAIAYDYVKNDFIYDTRVKHSIFGWHYDRYDWDYNNDGKVKLKPLSLYLKDVKEKNWIYK